ncbi:GM22551 [Drosophila sechellia]|uniref:GM22551 n=1 Tax=Drosophila sechellia TaxID=7238 RepID=B4IK81_DROSE|nr:GM22551 [Drosophila sechellia]
MHYVCPDYHLRLSDEGFPLSTGLLRGFVGSYGEFRGVPGIPGIPGHYGGTRISGLYATLRHECAYMGQHMIMAMNCACGSHEAAALHSPPAVIMSGHLLQAFMMQLKLQRPAAQRTRFQSLLGCGPRKTLIRHVGARRSVDVARTAANNNSSHGRHTGPRPRLGLRASATATQHQLHHHHHHYHHHHHPKPPTPAAAAIGIQNTATTTIRHNNNNSDDCRNNNVQHREHQGKLKNSVELERNKNIKKMSECVLKDD